MHVTFLFSFFLVLCSKDVHVAKMAVEDMSFFMYPEKISLEDYLLSQKF